jgi:trehalose 6-phosphate synthase/phosphatase
MADPEYGAAQANELKVHLTSLLSNAPVEVLSGDKVVELRPHGANKGRVASVLLQGSPRGVTVAAAFGDDKTDEDLFAALSPRGSPSTSARPEPRPLPAPRGPGRPGLPGPPLRGALRV